MSLYEPFLVKALEQGYRQSVEIERKRVGGITYIAIPEQKVLLEFHGLWYSNRHEQIPISDGARFAEGNGWRYLLLEESGRNHGVVFDESGRQIRLQRVETKAVRSGLKRCVKLSEIVLSHLTGEAVCLSPEQIEECTQYALEHSVMGNKYIKKRQQQER